VRLIFEDQGWEDYTSWLKTDRKTLARINKLIEDIRRDPFTGLGKPEPGKTVSLEIIWPSGQKDTIPDVKPDQFITLKEGKGIISAQPIVFARPAPVHSSTTASPQ